MTQLVTRIPDALARELDRLVAEGVIPSRSAAVRRGLEWVVDQQRRRLVGEAIVAGYRRLPQTEAEVTWPDEATARMIGDEPW